MVVLAMEDAPVMHDTPVAPAAVYGEPRSAR
jgi:hypothetical protein